MTIATTTAPAVGRRDCRRPRALHAAQHLLTAKHFSFVIFSVGMPLILYVVFTQTYGDGGGPRRQLARR